jgi:LysM repeat protein
VTPSPMQNVAGQATKATPAMAMAGVLVAAPHAHGAAAAPPRTATTAVVVQAQAMPGRAVRARTDAVVTRQQAATRHYTVQRGDTLSAIAQRFYGRPGDWNRIFQANKSVLSNPDMIFPGQVLSLPGGLTAEPQSSSSSGTGASELTSSSSLSGTLSCGGLEELWEEGGGSAGQAVTAASIAMAESGGQQFATGGVGERGYWQINPNHGALSTYDPLGNAKAAVIISANGTDWSPWTTFTSGAYLGRC